MKIEEIYNDWKALFPRADGVAPAVWQGERRRRPEGLCRYESQSGGR